MARAARAPRPGHGAEAFLIDTKFAGASKSLRHRVEEELLRDVRRILLTHSHCDHADGLERYHPASTMSWWPRVLEATSEAARLTVTPPSGALDVTALASRVLRPRTTRHRELAFGALTVCVKRPASDLASSTRAAGRDEAPSLRSVDGLRDACGD